LLKKDVFESKRHTEAKDIATGIVGYNKKNLAM
jgi:hypothetical protein